MLNLAAKVTYHALKRLGRPMPDNRRGVAILMAMASIAILSVSVVEFTYQTRVNVFVAANARDDLKSYYMAKSGMNLGVTLLNFQFELEKDPIVGRFMKRSNFQLYPMMNLFLSPFKSGSLASPIGSLDLAGGGATGFGGFHGTFDIDIVPEEGKIDINSFAGSRTNNQQLLQLCMLMFGEDHDDLFEVDYGNGRGAKLTRESLVGNLIDWVDKDENRLALNEFCVPEGTAGDESSPYDRSDAKYEVKNAKMTTIEEMRLVDGVSDAFFERFADSFTVYPVSKVNLNLANFFVLQSLLCANVSGADATNWPCRDPEVKAQVLYLAIALDGLRTFFDNPINLLFYYMNPESQPVLLDGAKKGQTAAYVNTRQLVRYIRTFKTSPEIMGQFIAYSPTAQALLGDQVLTVAATAPPIVIEFNERNLLRQVTVESPKVFRIVSEGSYGDSKKTLVSVVDFSKKKPKYLYWREY